MYAQFWCSHFQIWGDIRWGENIALILTGLHPTVILKLTIIMCEYIGERNVLKRYKYMMYNGNKTMKMFATVKSWWVTSKYLIKAANEDVAWVKSISAAKRRFTFIEYNLNDVNQFQTVCK